LKKRRAPIGSFLELTVSFLVLFLLLYASYIDFFARPYLGIHYQPSSGSILYLYDPEGSGALLRVGDRILQAGTVSLQEYQADRRVPLFRDAHYGTFLSLRVERDGQEISIDYPVIGPSRGEVIARLSSQWFLPYIFWVAGLAALMFLRPKNILRALLAAVFLLTAIWISMGILSITQMINSAVLMRVAIWLCLPCMIHLHWHFPSALRSKRTPALGLVYLAGLLVAAAEVFQWVPRSFFYLAYLVAVVSIAILLLIHFIRHPSERRLLGGLVMALGVCLIPLVVIGILNLLGVVVRLPEVATLGLSALPGFYFFSIYRRQLGPFETQVKRLFRIYLGGILGGTLIMAGISMLANSNSRIEPALFNEIASTLICALMAGVGFAPFLVLPALIKAPIILLMEDTVTLRLRANRATAYVFFLILLIPLPVLINILASRWSGIPGVSLLTGAATTLGVGLLVILVYPRFEQFYQARILGMPLQGDSLVKQFSHQIVTSLEMPALLRLLTEQIMPSLLIRQFLFLKVSADHFETLAKAGIAEDWHPDLSRLVPLPKSTWRPSSNGKDTGDLVVPAWVRVVIPLRVEGELLGVWVFGQRDPDDIYGAEELEVLTTLAMETALALKNIDQAHWLKYFYRSDIEKHEAERSQLAAELHDDVLNELAILGNSLGEIHTDARVFTTFQNCLNRVREIAKGLRPALLNYGLYMAFEALVDDLTDRAQDGPSISLDIVEQTAMARYDSKVELHVYRIIQQACANTLQHARANRLSITGRLEVDRIELCVVDDGMGMKGLANGASLDFTRLLENRHYGLVGMFERAELIGARLSMRSTQNQGLEINLSWEAGESHHQRQEALEIKEGHLGRG